MEAIETPTQRPWRWPLGWLALLELALTGGLWYSVWLWYYHQQFYYNNYWPLLLPLLWLALAGLVGLALLLVIKNLLYLRGWRAAGWLLVAGVAALNCAGGLLPLALSMGMGTTLEIPKE